jgi:hypothetical protein
LAASRGRCHHRVHSGKTHAISPPLHHWYLMTRLSLQVVCTVMYRRQRGQIYIMVVKFKNTIWPPPPQLSLHRRAALSSISNVTGSLESRENPKRSLYCEMSVLCTYECGSTRKRGMSPRKVDKIHVNRGSTEPQ